MENFFKLIGECLIIYFLFYVMCKIYSFSIAAAGIFIPIRLFGSFIILFFAAFSVILAFE